MNGLMRNLLPFALLAVISTATVSAQETSEAVIGNETQIANAVEMTRANLDRIPPHLQDKFIELAKAVEDSAKVFEKLSTEQMNHRPSNGSHTPRWNVEHNRGVQWMFFSQIFHELDSSVKVVREMPKQQPDDYQAKHPEWTGKQEADHTRAMMAFCVKNAGLLTNLQLDEKAPSNRWPTLGAFIDKMINHHGEHTANVVKKFEAADWPTN